jgi:hypothetical protein
MVRLGYVSTEGGPLLVADRVSAAAWRGASLGGTDYSRACELLEVGHGTAGGSLALGGNEGIVWDMPTGTADIWRRRPDVIVISRPWVGADEHLASVLATLPPDGLVLLGELAVRSGWAVILWAAENGAELSSIGPADGLAIDLSVGHAAVLVSLPPGEYRCYQDQVADGDASARRCWVVPRETGGTGVHTLAENRP